MKRVKLQEKPAKGVMDCLKAGCISRKEKIDVLKEEYFELLFK